MRRIVLWLASTVTIVVLLFGYHTSRNQTEAATAPTASAPSTSSSSPGSGGSTGSGSGSGSGGSGSDESGATPSPSPSNSSSDSSDSKSNDTSASGTYTGSVAQTRWGPVQVEITVAGSKITKVDVVQYPDGNHRDEEINAYAIPTLVQETLSQQSAAIDMVSGATVTSDGYVQSLQSALDKAGI
ncbi:hypothetical protein MLP_00190 [Microlunatus phosphovorus NM-1]|uniref:FMN-binding domain-containing protein n=1 Tax=Microlunatus phosphovorus (strain ATCC 700054 / DSM 10555 / JCM 9379 / NBRC 101784 / NCIMB 13414 / VKM Ac-1990 / NM-1) TaxID=1032480 RepID=F5XGC6_MICPN|nr:FMN-binding protein [Microlunatus phosphovorus]BAK33033.1 hypothetical protein MLP_00190 [Microlunatus phosphovorus NM-1]